jgi:hypothetical protein
MPLVLCYVSREMDASKKQNLQQAWGRPRKAIIFLFLYIMLQESWMLPKKKCHKRVASKKKITRELDDTSSTNKNVTKELTKYQYVTRELTKYEYFYVFQ